MNMNMNSEKATEGSSVNASISEALLKMKKEENKSKDGVNLLDITKKLSAKKFGKK